MNKEAMKLALGELQAGKVGIAMQILREALAEQPAQQLPFGVGGGLVAIKTLLSRDPCVHANTAIEMIDAILAEQPAQHTWVGLTDDEMIDLQDRCGISIYKSDFQAIEAKLKERNT